MTSTEPLRTTQRYSTGPAPCEKIVFPRGMTSVSVTAATRARSSASTVSKGGWDPRKPAISGTGSGSGWLVADADRRDRGTGPVLGQHRRLAAAQPHQVVDDAHEAEHAGEGERAPLEVPFVAAVDRRARPGQVDHDPDLED